jgi:hypothetical protein
MRPDAPAPQPGAEPTHTTIFRGPHPIAFNPRTDLEAIGTLVRSLHLTRRLPELGAPELRLLLTMAALANGRHFRATGELVCWPGEIALADALDFKRSSNVHRVIKALHKLDLVERATVEVDGRQQRVYRMILPEPKSDGGTTPTGGTVRDRRHMCARPKRARATERKLLHGARPDRAPPTAQSGRAQVPGTSSIETVKIETSKINNNNSTPDCAREPAAAGRSAVVVVAEELGQAGIGEAMAEELAELAGMTRLIARAAIIQASKRPEEHRTGMIVTLCRNPKRLSKRSMTEAEAQLRRPVSAAPSPAPSTLPAEKLAELKRALAHAAAKTGSLP